MAILMLIAALAIWLLKAYVSVSEDECENALNNIGIGFMIGGLFVALLIRILAYFA